MASSIPVSATRCRIWRSSTERFAPRAISTTSGRWLVGEVPESLTFILSDFMFPFDCTYHFQKRPQGTGRHEVKALVVLETSEKELPAGSKGVMPLSSYETGETVLLDLSKWKAYNQSRDRWLEETRDRMARAGMDSLVLTPEENFRLEIYTFMQQAAEVSR